MDAAAAHQTEGMHAAAAHQTEGMNADAAHQTEGLDAAAAPQTGISTPSFGFGTGGTGGTGSTEEKLRMQAAAQCLPADGGTPTTRTGTWRLTPHGWTRNSLPTH